MIALPGIKEKTFAVMGLGVSGLTAARALAESGARVHAWDDDATHRETAREQGIALDALTPEVLADAEALVLSPGIPHTFPAPHPVARDAREAGTPIICDIELLARARPQARFIAITGTNGKSTATALLGHVFDGAGKTAAVGGNLGPAALGLPALDSDGTYILELSSYQIERITSAVFDIAVLINITPDHLDRHGGMEGYITAKESLFGLARRTSGDQRAPVAVVGADDAPCRNIARRLRQGKQLRVIPVSGTAVPEGGMGADGTRLVDATGDRRREICDLADAIALPGPHNRQNAAAVAAAALAAGIGHAAIARALLSFPGLAHRQEPVRRIGGVTYVNDSKATNVDATLTALAAYRDIFWIGGGRAKAGGFDALARAAGPIRRAFLIGESASEIAHVLGRATDCEIHPDLQSAVVAAHRAAQAAVRETNGEAVVLLSPACASFDQFSSFEARGDAFRKAVMALPAPVGQKAACHPEGGA